MPENGLPRAYDLEQRDRYLNIWVSQTAPEANINQNDLLLNSNDITIGDLANSIFGNSPYLSKVAIKNPQCLTRFNTHDPNEAWAVFLDTLEQEISATRYNIEALRTLLRQRKEEVALHIAICDLCGLWNLSDITRSLSEFADKCVSTAIKALLLAEAEKNNVKPSNASDPQIDCGLFVLALGKLGAGELNYSSDIDLIVLYDIEALPYTGRKTPQEFMVKLTKELIRLLDERTADGYVFRTDLRLRPDPGSTAIAVSTETAELYYESWGQNWERSALIKARVIAGDEKVGSAFLKRLEPFIWRKSLDFYAIQDIHSIKRQIYASKGGREIDVLGHDIKIGRGGIREVEFFVQIQQLIWGGRNPALRQPQTLGGLKSLKVNGLVDTLATQELTDSYIFLRNLEHRMQMVNDEQTQKIPSDQARAEALSVFFGYATFDQFSDAVTFHLQQVERHYADLFEDAPDLTIDGNLVFTGSEHDPGTLTTLSNLGFENPEAISQIIRTWHTGRYRATKSTRSRQILTEIVPSLISAFSKTTQPDRALIKFDGFLERLPAGVQLFSVFYAHPEILELLADIMGDAPRLADYLNTSSDRFDYVLDPEFFEVLASTETLSVELHKVLERATDFEAKLDACRRWTNDLRFRVGVQALRYLVTPSAGAKALSTIAETTICTLVPYVCREFADKFGEIEGANLAVLAYGKLGGSELTPTSDLDLVFIYDSPIASESTGGSRSLSASVYYMRLTQRIISALTVLTADGHLYEIDLRLRPAGAHGPIATSLEAFHKYQRDDAWVWEHLALTKARTVYSTGQLNKKISHAIHGALKQKRTAPEVAKAISDMRTRVLQKHSSDAPWDIKHMAGGLMDTEFMIQFHALLNYESLEKTEPRDSLDTLESLKLHGVLQTSEADILSEATALWTNLLWLLRLTLDVSVSTGEIPAGLEKRFLHATGLASREALDREVKKMSKQVSSMFENTIERSAAAET